MRNALRTFLRSHALTKLRTDALRGCWGCAAGVVLILLFAGLSERSQAQTRDDRMSTGIEALNAGRYDDALGQFNEVLQRWPDNAEAHFRSAWVHLFRPDPDPDLAKQALRIALRLDRDNAYYRELDLWRDYRFGSSFLPALRTTVLAEKAEQLLAQDSTRALAHLVRGAVAYADYRSAYRAIEFGNLGQIRATPLTEDAVIGAALFLFDTELEDSENGEIISFYARERGGRRVPYVEKPRDAERNFILARDHLMSAIHLRPDIAESYQVLLKTLALRSDYEYAFPALEFMQRSRPTDPASWWYSGLARYQIGDYAGAESSFDRALEHMSEQDLEAFTRLDWMLSDDELKEYQASREAFANDFWFENDPRFTTVQNERQLEHFARLVYADLRFGDTFAQRRGWHTEPGQVIIRYGWPRAEARFGTMTDAYLVFHYGERYFFFMDLSRADRFTFYSPPATAFLGSRSPVRPWQADYSIRAGELFRETPRVSQFAPERELSIETLPSFFREGDSILVVVPIRVSKIVSHPGGARITTSLFGVERGEIRSATSPRRAVLRRSEEVYETDRSSVDDVLELRISSGAHLLAVEAAQDVVGAFGSQRFESRVWDPDSILNVSDLMLASLVEESSPGDHEENAFVRNGHTIRPLIRTDIESGPLYLYFEIYGIELDEKATGSVRIEAALVEADDEPRLQRLLRRIFGGDEPGYVSVSFEEISTSTDISRYVILETESLEAGEYLVILRVSDLASGVTAESKRSIRVVR